MADSTHDTDSGQVAADLRAAADVLERDGWTQFTSQDDYGCRCATGAIAYAASQGRVSVAGELLGIGDGAGERAYRRWKEATDALRERIGRTDVMDWNDERDRTATEVVAAMRSAAEAQS